jgi:hypothetical protein
MKPRLQLVVTSSSSRSNFSAGLGHVCLSLPEAGLLKCGDKMARKALSLETRYLLPTIGHYYARRLGVYVDHLNGQPVGAIASHVLAG